MTTWQIGAACLVVGGLFLFASYKAGTTGMRGLVEGGLGLIALVFLALAQFFCMFDALTCS